MLWGEKVAGEDCVNVMEGETERLVRTLELFNESGGISDMRPQPLLYLREITCPDHAIHPSKPTPNPHKGRTGARLSGFREVEEVP